MPKNIPTSVELHIAYHWFCEVCSETNYALPSRRELTDDEKQEGYRVYHGMDEDEEIPEDRWKEFFVLQLPTHVICKNCGHKFEAIDELIP